MVDIEFLERAEIELKWCWWPRSCSESGRLLWFTFAYRATRMWTGPGTPVFEHRWYDRNEFIILRLKGNGDD
jgi:hypothetical protein